MQNSLTYKQARAHAQQCGVDVSRFQAVPVARMNRARTVAQDVMHPETQESFILAGTIVHPEFMRMMGLHSGVDYVVCYK
jgi:hypothetical protein